MYSVYHLRVSVALRTSKALDSGCGALGKCSTGRADIRRPYAPNRRRTSLGEERQGRVRKVVWEVKK